MPAIELAPVTPSDAVEFFRQKGYAFGFDHRDVWEQEHAAAFTVAKAMRIDILRDIRAAVDEAIANGTPFDEFKNALQPILQRKGWWGQRDVVDPLTGETVSAQLGSPRRLKTIFDMNTRTAYAGGKWRRVERTKAARPWLRYVAVRDERTRPEHLAWHGTVLPADHAFWRTHYPPNGWRCRCTVQQLADDDLQRIGERPTVPAPPIETRPVLNKRSGAVQDVPIGIDPGFAHNPGRFALADRRKILIEKLDAAAPDMARPAVAAEVTDPRFRDLVAGKDAGPLPAAVLPRAVARTIGARGRVVRLSNETAARQARRHPELAPEDYVRVQRAIDEGAAVKHGDRHAAFALEEDGTWWWVVVKAARDGRALHLQSFRRIHRRQAERLAARGAPIGRDQ